MNEVDTALRHAFERCGARGRSVCVALSGGLDSVVLLHAAVALRQTFDLQLSALHVDHGLSPRAQDWARFCSRLCASLEVPISVRRVTVATNTGLGTEAAARARRYEAFWQIPADFLLLAHHQDDQAETLLLQLLRGAGVQGLSAMPMERPLGTRAPRLLRPFLMLQRSQLAGFAADNALEWIEDESNAQTVYDRNYLRHTVLPLIEARFPAYRSTLSRSGRNLADAAQLAAILGEQDLAATRSGNGIVLDRMRDWPEVRVRNALRALFRELGHVPPRRSLLSEAARQAFHAGEQAQVRVDFGDVSLRRYRGVLYLVRNIRAPRQWEAQWHGEETLALPPGLGVLHFRRSTGEGISSKTLQDVPVTVTMCRDGGRMALAANRPRRSLRKLYQDAAIPPWERERTPLLFCGGQLACVPGLGIAAPFQAAPAEASWVVDWLPA